MRQPTVLVTGASSGIGKAIARRVVSQGYWPILVARDLAKLQALHQEIGTGEIHSCDVTQEVDIQRLVDRVISSHGGLDVLINNAGYGRFGGSLEISLADYSGMMETNYLGTVRMTQAFLPHLLRQEGRIVNIASIAGLTGIPNLAAYSASKFAILGYSESLALEFSPRIGVGVLCPGPVKTPFFQGEKPGNLFPPLIANRLLDADTVAYHAVDLIKRPRILIIPGSMRWAMRLRRFFPGFYHWVLKRIYDAFAQQKPSVITHEERVP
jgi:short-subunit dehydrogenase